MESDADTFCLAYLKKGEQDDISENSELDFFTEDENDSQYSGHSPTNYSTESSSFDKIEELEYDNFAMHRANKLFRYVNFNCKEEISLSLSDFDWDDQARGVLYRYAPDIAQSLTDQAEHAFEMTNE